MNEIKPIFTGTYANEGLALGVSNDTWPTDHVSLHTSTYRDMKHKS